MPKSRSREGEHVAYTDHTIARRPGVQRTTGDRRLRSFWPGEPAERDLAIAMASLGRPDQALLEKLQGSDDVGVLTQLGQLYDSQGKSGLAEALYERILKLDPSSAAGANLAIYRARKGRIAEAIALWQDVFARYPALAGAGINLAVAQSGTGDREGARRTIDRLLQFHPGITVPSLPGRP
jgi:tetratricopeptide (TPR) repeat protein